MSDTPKTDEASFEVLTTRNSHEWTPMVPIEFSQKQELEINCLQDQVKKLDRIIGARGMMMEMLCEDRGEAKARVKELKEALNVWDDEEIESLSSLLNRIGHHLDSGNIIIEYGAYNILLEVIEKQRQALQPPENEL